MKVWDRVGIELATPGSAVRLASVARHVTDCATRTSVHTCKFLIIIFVRMYSGHYYINTVKAGKFEQQFFEILAYSKYI